MSIANTTAETITAAGIIDENDQVLARVEHLKELEKLVGNSYPNKFSRSKISTGENAASNLEDTISNLLAYEPIVEIVREFDRHKAGLSEGENPDQELKAQLNEKLKALGSVSISGRLAVPPRVMGKAAFVHLSDGVNRLQIYVRRDDAKAIVNGKPEPSAAADGLSIGSEFSAEAAKADHQPSATADGSDTVSGWEVFKLLDHGDFIGASGFLFLTNTGELSVHVETFQFLAKALMPMPDKMNEIGDAEISRRYRYVDLIASSLRNKTDEEIEEEKRTGIRKLTTREVFERRARLISGMRRFLDDAGYIEVETPMLTPKATGAAATPFETHHNALDIPLYARIAPELYLKRLTVGGFEKVYELNRNFRNEGLSHKHNPEFTMLEFYCAYMDVNGMMDFAEEMIKESVQKATGGSLQVSYTNKSSVALKPHKSRRVPMTQFINLDESGTVSFEKFERISMKQAIIRELPETVTKLIGDDKSWLNKSNNIKLLTDFLEWLKDDFLMETFDFSQHYQGVTRKLPEEAEAELIKNKWKAMVDVYENLELSDSDAEKQLIEIFDEYVEPKLIQPTFVIDYPKSISPLSKASPENPQIAERFELFINGMECANGFSELNDPQEQFERFVDQAKERESGDAEAMVLDEDYIRALAYGMPPAAGIGIGIDRLVMLLTDKHSIRDVILFPHLRPEKGREEENEAEETKPVAPVNPS